jgi:16S rRNA (cytosine1402-N4)-methyltransferase
MPAFVPTHHVPVLLDQVVEAARAVADLTPAVDATLGDGGHAAALAALGVRILGIDRDPDAIATARHRLGDAVDYLEAAYDSPEALAAVAEARPGFILLDLGVSSRQLDETGRGFTFRPGAPLDMRMGRDGPTGADLLNHEDPDALERVFAEYGDERRARRLAREVERRRARHPFAVSDDLVNAIRSVLGPRAGGVRASLSGRADRGERGVGGARASAARVP